MPRPQAYDAHELSRWRFAPRELPPEGNQGNQHLRPYAEGPDNPGAYAQGR